MSQRTPSEIQKDYNIFCAQLGDIEFKLSMGQEDARRLRAKIRELNKEANRLQAQAEAEEANKAKEEAKNEQA